jgi:nitrous oxide reductase
MPSHDAQHEPAERMSRRSLLQGAAAAGAAGLAVTALGAAVRPAAAAASTAAAGTAAAGTASSAPAHGDLKAPEGPIVVHVRNAKSGDIEVFSGTSQTSLRDKDLAARIARAIG